MVYCTKCGAQNEDNAINCTNCGDSLSVSHRESRGWEEEIETRAEDFGRRAERFGRNMEDECFGLPGGSSIIGILFGLAIILLGARELFGWRIDFGPFAIIVVGVLILAGALYQMNKRKR
jgi:hypothetical protein